MVEHVPIWVAKSFAKHIQRVLQMYWCEGFSIRIILVDREFEKIKDIQANIECNTTAAKEHMSKGRHMIRTIREQTRRHLESYCLSTYQRG